MDISLAGETKKIIFHNPSNGFCVFSIATENDNNQIIVTSCPDPPMINEFVKCTGEWQQNSRYGMQFKAKIIESTPPYTLPGIEKYLQSKQFQGIGPRSAKLLVKNFGRDILTVIEKEPKKILEIRGIGPKTYQKILEGQKTQKKDRDIMIFLWGLGIGSILAQKIYTQYKEETIKKIKENPWCLTEINGIGFRTADIAASHMNVAYDSIQRADACVGYVLQENISNEGHCAISREKLLLIVKSLLKTAPNGKIINIDDKIIEQAIENSITKGKAITEVINEKTYLFPSYLFRAENNVANTISSLLQDNKNSCFGITQSTDIKKINKIVNQMEKNSKITFSISQREAVAAILKNKFIVITGGPGVGKTTIIKAILDHARQSLNPEKIVLCAPTGRAAQRMKESTNFYASTIHKLLNFDQKTGKFKPTSLDIDLLIVDEASMIDIVLMQHLLVSIPSTTNIIFLGDADQLPSVGPGNVLHDLIKSEKISVMYLNEIYRQAANSGIVVNAHRINNRQMPIPGVDSEEFSDFKVMEVEKTSDFHDYIIQTIDDLTTQGFDPLKDIQVLTPMYKGSAGVDALNIALQQKLNSNPDRFNIDGTFYTPGDKIIQLKNDYEKDVFNGNVGFIEHIDKNKKEIIIAFEDRKIPYRFTELRKIRLAYAISIHKSQGSEYPAVVIALSKQHFMLLDKNLLYTALTRGRKMAVIVAEPDALRMAVKMVRARSRITNLAQRIQDSTASISRNKNNGILPFFDFALSSQPSP